MNRKHISIGKWLNNHKFVFVLSVFLAVVIWLVVALQFSERMEATFSDIPVTFETSMTDKLDLQMFGQTDVQVTVTVTGKRYEISSFSLSKEDFVVTASTANVSSAGKYTLPISVKTKDTTKDIEILSVSPETVDIYFDGTLTENYPVEVEITAPDDKIAADGFISYDPLVSPAQVTITGAAAEVQKIHRVLAKVTLDAPLSKTTTFQKTALAIVNANGGIVRSTYVHVENSTKEVTVTVPIYKRIQFTPTVLFKNQPAYFVDHEISYICSPSGPIQAAETTAMQEGAENLSLGTIDFSEIKIGTNSFEFPVKNILNLRFDDVDTFRVYFSIDGFESKKITIPAANVTFGTLPDGKKLSIPEDAALEVTVIGHAEELEALTAADVNAVVDTSALEENGAAAALPVMFTVENTNTCWVSGSYTVPVEVA